MQLKPTGLAMLRTKLLLAIIPTLLLAACGEPEDTRPGQPVAHRRAAFKEILKSFEPMGLQLRNERYEPKQFLALAKEVDKLKEGPWQYFAPDTNYPPSKAKAAVWSEADKFEAARQTFLKASAGLVTSAESRDEKQIKTAYDTLHDSCRSCHKAFKD